MVLETTHRDKEVLYTIDTQLGKPFSLWKRLQMGGIGSKRMMVKSYSDHFTRQLSANTDITYANIELRPKGVILHFNKRLCQYSWIIPYENLNVSEDENFSIYTVERFMEFEKNSYYAANKEFISKMIALKEEFPVF